MAMVACMHFGWRGAASEGYRLPQRARQHV
jgi:hypothetical protein